MSRKRRTKDEVGESNEQNEQLNILYTSSSIVQVAHVKPVQFPKRGEPGLSRRAVEMATSHRHHTATKIKQVFSY